MSDKKLFSAWFRDQITRTDRIGDAAKAWNTRHGLDRRGRVNAARLEREGKIPADLAKQVMEAYAAA